MTRPVPHLTFSERFCGLEFDWFAQDAEGNIGLFSTAGLGPVPRNVPPHFQDHDRAALSIDLPHTGSLAVWEDFARQGLYVFDWQPHQGPYRKLKQPEGDMPAALRQDVLQIADLPLFNGTFRQVAGIIVQEGGELTTA